MHNQAVEPICRRYLNLRYRLLPYLYSAVYTTHTTGLPLMRSLWLAYPEDPRAVSVADAYLWGESFLVAPVLEAGATHRTTYLPRGQWWDYWTGAMVEGGVEVTRAVDLETMPLYVKAGAILPVGAIKQYAQEASSEPLLLRVYPGADGTLVLYEDDGATFGFERGAFTRIDCSWNDRERTLTLQADEAGDIPDGRIFSIELAGSPGSRSVEVSGGAVAVRL